MKILVANLGTTSFKYRLYDLAVGGAETLLARGSVERVGSDNAKVVLKSDRGEFEMTEPIADHGVALKICLDQLTDPKVGVLKGDGDVAAIGFKAVHAKGVTGVRLVTEDVLEAMEDFADVCPAHNPPYIKAMRTLGERFPALPLVAAFETGFHRTIPEANQRYAIPEHWATVYGIRRWGFHGASHRYIAGRMAEILKRDDLKIISCHLGGSSSLCAIKDGRSQACSLGMSPQSGLPHNNRVGDFDVFALPTLLRESGQSLDEILSTLANNSGLEGLSGAGRDLRDIEFEANAGNPQATLALEVFVASVRQYLGSYLVELNGADAIVFTGGIGENSVRMRLDVCRNLDWFGIKLDMDKNAHASGEALVSAEGSRVQVWTVPTNEEIVVARQARDLLNGKTS
jgi:acetate kinase